MSSLARMLALLDVFSEDQPSWTADQLMDETQSTRATIYRYLKNLTDAGLLAPASEGKFVLGPKIIQMERLIRQQDPVVQAAGPVMSRLGAERQNTILLASYYGNRVLCLRQENCVQGVRSSYERGRPMPLFRGATSKIILAYLSPYYLRNLALRHAKEISEAGLGNNWAEFRDIMKQMRKQGYCFATSEVDQGAAAVAAPIFLPLQKIVASLTVVFTQDEATESNVSLLAKVVRQSADEISAAIASPRIDERTKFSALSARGLKA
jgi:DNA-binding IclR family transcriptional regulator